MEGEVNRRNFLGSLGVSVGAALATAGGALPVVGVAHAQDKPKGNIPDKPYKIGHMTFFTGRQRSHRKIPVFSSAPRPR